MRAGASPSPYMAGCTNAQRKSAKLASRVPGSVVSQSMIATGIMSRKMKLGWDRFGWQATSEPAANSVPWVRSCTARTSRAPGLHALLAEREPVVGRREALDERQDLAAARVDSQKPRRAVEPAVPEVGKQPVNAPGAGRERPAYRIADPHNARGMAAGERQLRFRGPHTRIIAGAQLRDRCVAGSLGHRVLLV